MSWKEKIPRAFGSQDKKFAGHDIEKRNAADLFHSAVSEGVGYSDYVAEIERWLRNEGCSSDHVTREMTTVRDISSYFRKD